MFTQQELSVIEQAAQIIEIKAKKTAAISSAILAKQLCTTKLAHLEHEVFAALFLDSQHRLIEFKNMFTGTIDAASVYPREVVKAALYANAAAVIFSHNHPSGVAEPSTADQHITKRLVNALELIDVKVLDHIVVGVEGSVSFAERGLL
jgi:DNA repair protein RadC